MLFSILTSPFYILSKELYSTFIRKKSNMEIQGEPLLQEFLNFYGHITWTSFNKPFKLLFFYTFILTWNEFLAVLELLVVFTMNFCRIFVYTSNYTQLEVGHFFCHFKTCNWRSNVPQYKFRTMHAGARELIATNLSFFLYFKFLCYFNFNFLVIFLERKYVLK